MADVARGLLRGPKFNGKHTTLIAPAERLVVALRDDDRVTKIIIGLIKSKRGGGFALKINDVAAGLKLTVSSPTNIQELYAYTAEPEALRATLEAIRLG